MNPNSCNVGVASRISVLLIGLGALLIPCLQAGIVPLAGQWVSSDIGSPTVSGSASYDSQTEVTSVQGSGAGIDETTDEGFLFHGEIKSGESISAKVNALASGGLGSELAGIMVRTSTDVNSGGVFMGFDSLGTARLLWRPDVGESPIDIGISGVASTDWIRLSVSNHTVIASKSGDGTNWTPIKGVDLPFATSFDGGLFVTGGDGTSTASAEFIDVARGKHELRVDLTYDEGDATATGVWNHRFVAPTAFLLEQDFVDDVGITKGAGEIEIAPAIPFAGDYEVYFRWPADPSNDVQIPVTIGYGAFQTYSTTIDQTVGNGEWFYLGTFQFDTGSSSQFFRVSNVGTSGTVTFDSVKLIGAFWTDTDTDGLVDSWELLHFGSLTAEVGTGDPDNDGLSNLEELFAGSDPNVGDSDSDFLGDSVEVLTHSTSPLTVDSDRDGLPDEWEVNNSLDPLDAKDVGLDPDGDGWSNWEEYLKGSNPQSDLSPPVTADKYEDLGWASEVLATSNVVLGVGGQVSRNYPGGAWTAGAESDKVLAGDGSVRFRFSRTDARVIVGLNDKNENTTISEIDYGISSELGLIVVYEAGIAQGSFGAFSPSDIFEIERNTGTIRFYKNGTQFYVSSVVSHAPYLVDCAFFDPYVAVERVQGVGFLPGIDVPEFDSDGDGLTNGWEVTHGLNPLDPNDATQDVDGDGVSNLSEFLAGTDPTLIDSDGDFVTDSLELLTGTDPTVADPYSQSLGVLGSTGLKALSPVKNYID